MWFAIEGILLKLDLNNIIPLLWNYPVVLVSLRVKGKVFIRPCKVLHRTAASSSTTLTPPSQPLVFLLFLEWVLSAAALTFVLCIFPLLEGPFF